MSGWQRLSVLVAKMTVLGNQDAVLHPRRRLRRLRRPSISVGLVGAGCC
jgi:hypothetical protein